MSVLPLILALAAATPVDDAGAETGADEARRYSLAADVMFRTLAIRDEDPSNDEILLWLVGGSYEFFEGGKAYLRLGLNQAFTAEVGESAFQVRDTELGFRYQHSLEVEAIDRELGFDHRVTLFLPTSRVSQAQDLYVAPEGRTSVRLPIYDGLSVAPEARFQYRFHEFAERAGQFGGLNTQLVLRGTLNFDYEISLEKFNAGGLNVGFDLDTAYFKKYPSREEFEAPDDRSVQELWLQSYGWDVYAAYTPIRALTVAVSLEQGGRVLRDGIVNTFFTHRDETELVFLLQARY